MEFADTFPARRTDLAVEIGGHDATSYLAPCLTEFEYTDNASGKADELSLTLHDREGHWYSDWKPKKGTEVSATLTVHDWERAGDTRSLPCGAFKIDEIEFSGPPDKISIKAVSAALTGGLRDARKTQAWEGYTLKRVAGEIAARSGLALMYSGADHSFSRRDQREESDLAFVQRLATDCGMSCKVHDGRLVLFDARAADAAPAALVICRAGAGSPASYSFREASADTDYTTASVDYADPDTGQTHSVTVAAAGQAGGDSEKNLALNERVESSAEAMRLGRSRLRKKNAGKLTCTLTLMGNPALVAGVTVELRGFGAFDGMWFAEKTTHRVSPDYTTSADLRRTMED